MLVRNLTPHVVNVCDDAGKLLFEVEPSPSGVIARVSVTREKAASLTLHGDEVPTYRVAFGSVEGLPEPVLNVALIVSAVVAGHPEVRGREDVFCPGELVRDATGQPVGCKGLTRA